MPARKEGDPEKKKVAKEKAPARPTARKSSAGGASLVVVESPAKAKTLQKYLGGAFDVKASAGHVKDLPRSSLGVDIEKGFQPAYEVIKGKAKVLSELKRAANKAEQVFLATDPDREGELIAWHIADEIGHGDGKVRRVLLDQITKEAIEKAISKPQDLDRRKLDSQQARRILDRLVGYQVSPILWKKVRRGLSAGRVPSVAVRLVVERERALQAFEPEGRWSLEADLAAGLPPELRARLVKLAGQKVELADAEATRALATELEKERFVVAAVERTERRRNPPPPFTTATLQREAASRLGFSAKKTMTLAQRLYEGVDLGDEGAVGLISYVRTDSVRLSNEAVEAVRGYIGGKFGEDHLSEAPSLHRTREKRAQAHEAVRPTSLEWTPERAAPFFEEMGERDMHQLYELIWNRFVASQMVPAVYEETTADVAAGRAAFRARGSTLKSPGYLAVYGTQRPEEEAGAEPEAGDAGEDAKERNRERILPPLEAGMELRLLKLDLEQHFTEPPPRFDESSLIEELEVRGIGRPATYAAILSSIQEKAYVEKVERNFRPTELGTLVTDELVRAFPREMDVAFAAGVEGKLDEIEEGHAQWQAVLSEFYATFKEDLARAEVQVRGVKRQETSASLACEKCGKPMVVKWGRMGEFLACTGYPECRNTMDFRRGEGGAVEPIREEEVATDEKCPTCAAPMVVRRGRYGRFLACTRYPACKTSKPISIGVSCPKGCGGYISERRSRGGKTFYGCSSYPNCDFVSWDRPRAEACPKCGSTYLVDKVSKKEGALIACPQKECDYRREPEGVQPGGADQDAPPMPEEMDA